MAPRRRAVEVRWDPESEKRLREGPASPEGQRLLRELAMILARAAVDRMLAESAESVQKTDAGE